MQSTPSPKRDRPARVSLVQPASQAVLDDGARGMVDALAARGFVDGQNPRAPQIQRRGDAGVSNAIAKEMVNSDADLLLTVSTLSLQAVANANRTMHKPHVFALVSDPSATGVGISHENPLEHPAWMAGYGTMQPVEQAFQIARAMKPDLERVGVVWNAAEANSEGQLKDRAQALRGARHRAARVHDRFLLRRRRSGERARRARRGGDLRAG